ncbi:MAG: replication-associated recombination protein A [Deltaproteobacteria bacterium]|nr:replication-associated recombination protein A [Deltaproteobacteria bacterium]
MRDLFEDAADRTQDHAPLADRMRPRRIEEVLGQAHILGEGRLLRRLLETDQVPSMILFGPPGSGKTTLAHLIARRSAAAFEKLSAVMSGVAELREVLKRAQRRRAEHRERTILFVDEIHRWSKAQQDALLEAVEKGIVTLIGATTENPSYEINTPLLSRARVFALESLGEADLVSLIDRTLADNERGLGNEALTADDDVKRVLAGASDGDARRLLSILEVAAKQAASTSTKIITKDQVEEAVQHRALAYDKAGDTHYGVVSAFIKSMRGSDPDAAAYYLVRMLEAGEDPRFILRRIIIFASEDIGNADPRALGLAVDALHAFELVGLPEGVLPLTQVVTYLASAPKSNTALTTYARARSAVLEHGALPVPLKLANAQTSLDRSMGRGKNYKYPHDVGGFVPEETYLPEKLQGRRFYEPKEAGYERTIRRRIARWRAEEPED